MTITKEQALAELQKRGYDVNNLPPITNITQQQAGEELERRGINFSAKRENMTKTALEVLGGISPKDSFEGSIGGGSLGRLQPQEPDLKTQQKHIAYQQLQIMGYSPNDIDTLNYIWRETHPKFFDLKQQGPQTGGSIAGGITGGALGMGVAGPPGAFVGGIIGSGIGGGLGRALTPQKSGEPPTGKQITGAMLSEAGSQLAGETISYTLGKVTPFLKRPIKEVIELEKRMKKKVPALFLPVGAKDTSYYTRFFENISKGGFVSKDIWDDFFTKLDANIYKVAESNIDDMAKGLQRLTPEQTGQEFLKLIGRNVPGGGKGEMLEMFDDLVNPVYQYIDKQTGKNLVKTAKIKSTVLPQYIQDLRLNKTHLSPQGRAFSKKILDLPDNISLDDMRTLRSDLLRIERKFTRDADISQGLIKDLAGAADDSIFDVANNPDTPPKLLQLLRNTNDMYKKGKDLFTNTFSYQLSNKLAENPSSAAKLFEEGNPTQILAIRNGLTKTLEGKPYPQGQMAFNRLRQAWTQDLLEKSVSSGKLNANTYNMNLLKMGDAGLSALFPEPEILQGIKDVGKVLVIAERTGNSGTVLFTKGLQVGGGYKMYKGARAGEWINFMTGGALAIGPEAWAKLETSQIGNKLLSMGISMPKGSKMLGPIAVKMTYLLQRIDADEQEALESYERQITEQARMVRLPFTKQAQTQSGRSKLGFGSH